MKVNCIEPYPECFFNPHPSLKKLKIECDSGSITPQAIKQISANKIEGFRLRIHWNRYIYRIEDIIRVTQDSPKIIFNLRFQSDLSLISFEDALRYIYSDKTCVGPKPDHNPIA